MKAWHCYPLPGQTYADLVATYGKESMIYAIIHLPMPSLDEIRDLASKKGWAMKKDGKGKFAQLRDAFKAARARRQAKDTPATRATEEYLQRARAASIMLSKLRNPGARIDGP